MELAWGVLLIAGIWIGYQMGRGEALEIKLPDKLKAVIRDDDAQAAWEKEQALKNQKKKQEQS